MVDLLDCILVIWGERVAYGATQGEQVARFSREGARLRPEAENRQIEHVAVGVRDHPEQASVVIWLVRIG